MLRVLTPPRSPRSLTPPKAVSPAPVADTKEDLTRETREILREELDVFSNGTLMSLLEKQSQTILDRLNSNYENVKHLLELESSHPVSTRRGGTSLSDDDTDWEPPSPEQRPDYVAKMGFKPFDKTLTQMSSAENIDEVINGEARLERLPSTRHSRFAVLEPVSEFGSAFSSFDLEMEVDGEKEMEGLHQPINLRDSRSREELASLVDSSKRSEEDFDAEERKARTLFFTEINEHPCSLAAIGALVRTAYFEHVAGFLIMANAILLGIETEWQAQYSDASFPVILTCLDTAFLIAFSFELALRIAAVIAGYSRPHDFFWNLFDGCVIGAQIAESMFAALMNRDISKQFMWIKMLRTLRCVRILRLVRVFRHFAPLATLVGAVMNSLKSLGWTLVLLGIVIYNFSVLFTQVVWNAIDDGVEHEDRLKNWFGSLFRTSLSLYEAIVGGVSWCEIIDLLIFDVSPMMGVLFCVYIAICIFILCNIVTGVFVDQATTMEKEGNEEAAARDIKNLFLPGGEDLDISCEHFRRMFHNKEMQNYFRMINLCPSEGVALFRLLDVDNSGTVDAQELVEGLLRLRGTAKALDLQLLMRQLRVMDEDVSSQLHRIGHQLRVLTKAIKSWQIPRGKTRPRSSENQRQVSSEAPSPGSQRISLQSYDSYGSYQP